MQIDIVPTRGLPGHPPTAISVSGDTITVSGAAFDLSAVPEGGEGLPAGDHPFIGPITRTGGVIRCAVLVRLGDDAAFDQPTDPAHWLVEAGDGPVTIPALPRAVTP